MKDTELISSFSAEDWAREFCDMARRVYDIDIDEGHMQGWFANALMAGYDHRSRTLTARQAVDILASHEFLDELLESKDRPAQQYSHLYRPTRGLFKPCQ